MEITFRINKSHDFELYFLNFRAFSDAVNDR